MGQFKILKIICSLTAKYNVVQPYYMQDTPDQFYWFDKWTRI